MTHPQNTTPAMKTECAHYGGLPARCLFSERKWSPDCNPLRCAKCPDDAAPAQEAVAGDYELAETVHGEIVRIARRHNPLKEPIAPSPQAPGVSEAMVEATMAEQIPDAPEDYTALVERVREKIRIWIMSGEYDSRDTTAKVIEFCLEEREAAIASLERQLAEVRGERDALTIQSRVVKLDRDGAVKRMNAAEAERDRLAARCEGLAALREARAFIAKIENNPRDDGKVVEIIGRLDAALQEPAQ